MHKTRNLNEPEKEMVEANPKLFLTEIAGLNPLDTLAEVQAELDKDNSSYWNKWRARRESN